MSRLEEIEHNWEVLQGIDTEDMAALLEVARKAAEVKSVAGRQTEIPPELCVALYGLFDALDALEATDAR